MQDLKNPIDFREFKVYISPPKYQHVLKPCSTEGCPIKTKQDKCTYCKKTPHQCAFTKNENQCIHPTTGEFCKYHSKKYDNCTHCHKRCRPIKNDENPMKTHICGRCKQFKNPRNLNF